MTTVVQFIVAILLSASVSSAYGQASTNLALPSNARANVLKVLPNQSVRAVSNRNDFLYLFNSSGQLTRTVDLNENRTSATRYGDFDFWVNAKGDIFVLSVWKDQALKSGVFIYDNHRYNQYGNLLNEYPVKYRESGTLIRKTGTTAYTSVVKLRTRDGNSVLIRSD